MIFSRAQNSCSRWGEYINPLQAERLGYLVDLHLKKVALKIDLRAVMLLSVKCLLCYHGDPGSVPTMHMKKARCGCSFLESLGRQKQVDPLG